MRVVIRPIHADSRVATRPIHLDRREIQKSVNRLMDAIEKEHNKDLNGKLGNAFHFDDEVVIKSVSGNDLKVVVAYRGRNVNSTSFAPAGGSGIIKTTKKPFIVIYLNGNLFMFDIMAFRRQYEEQVEKILMHELTHSADIFETKPSIKPYVGDVPEGGIGDMGFYYNHPSEVRAYMRQVFEDILPMLPGALKRYPVNVAFKKLLPTSRTWRQQVQEYMSEENRKILLKGVYQAVEDWIDEQAMVIVASVLEDAFLGKGRQAGMLEPPPAMVEDITKWAEAMYSMHRVDLLSKYADHKIYMMKMYQDNIDNPTDISLADDPSQVTTTEEWKEKLKKQQEEYNSTMADVKSHLEKAKSYPNLKMQKWKRVAKKFRVDITGWRYKSVLEKADPTRLAMADKLFGVVTVELTTGDLQGSAKAYWMGSKSLIRISIGENIRDEVEHELTHWTQSYLNIALRIPDFGRPSKDIRTPEMFKVFVGMKEPPKGLDKVMSRFFSTLKKHAPEKWKKAVKELEKAVL